MVKKLNELLKLNAEQQARTDFVSAASGLMMADGQSQDPMRAQVRFRNGDMVYVKDLPVIDRKNPQPNGDYVVALVADHEGKTKVQAGGLWLFVENGKLHALVLWSKNKVAADLKPLADDRVLQFSTEGYVDEIGEDGKYGDFWIHTLSPVTVGNDPGTEVLNDIKLDGRILVRNALRFDNRGEEMPASKKPAAKKPAAKKENEITPEEEQVIVDRVTEQVLAAMQEGDTENDAIDPDDIEEEDDVEGEEGDDNQDDDAADDADDDAEEEEEETVPAKNKLSTTPKSPKANARPKQPIAKVSEKRGEQEEIVAFSNALAQAARDGSGVAGVRACMNVYNSKVKKNIIADGSDSFVPTSIVTTFFKAWVDNENMKWARFMNKRAGAVYAATTDDTALDHKKTVPATAKTNQDLNLIRRDLLALAVYKRLPIDAQDLWDDHDGQFIKFRTQELSSRIANQIIKAAVLGGNTPGSVGSTNGGGTRGLHGIIADSEETDDEEFGYYVASAVEGEADEDKYAAVIRTLDQIVLVEGGNITSAGVSSDGISLIVPQHWLASLLLTKNNNDNYQFTRENIKSLLGVSSITQMPELVASQKIIAIADGAYQLYGENKPKMYPRFDDVYNQDVLLAEQFIAGSLAGYKQAAVYTPAAES